MWKALVVSLVLSTAMPAIAAERGVTISSSETGASGPCLESVISELPGRFLPDERPQALTVRRMGAGPRDIFCWYEAVIWDARRPYPGGAIAQVWSGVGPGQVFADAHWRDSGWSGRLDVRVVRLASFSADSVLVTAVSTERARTLTHTQLVAFNQLTGFSESILDIALDGEMQTRIDGDRIVVTLAAQSRSCRACGQTQRIALRFNRDVGVMELDAPTPEAIALYRSLTARARTAA